MYLAWCANYKTGKDKNFRAILRQFSKDVKNLPFTAVHSRRHGRHIVWNIDAKDVSDRKTNTEMTQ